MEVIDFKNKIWDLTREIAENMSNVFCPIAEKYGLTMMQVRILLEIMQHGEHTVGSLGKSMSIAGGNISAMCKKLEKLGFLERIRDQEDERVVKVVLSKTGLDIISEIDNTMQNKFSPYLKGEPQQTLDDIIGGLQKLNYILKRMNSVTKGEIK